MRYLTALLAAGLLVPGPAAASQLAITEFLANAAGSDSRGEWLELFNYGSAPIDLAGWSIGDADANHATLPATTIPAGHYLIIARNKTAFQSRWLGGRGEPRVREAAGALTLSNGADELILETPAGATAWQLAYGSAAVSEGRSLFLDPGDGFASTDFGTKGSPGVVVGGVDATGTMGYEACLDPSTCADLVHSTAGETGSPLGGGYGPQGPVLTVGSVPAPGTLLCLGAGAMGLVGAARRPAPPRARRCGRRARTAGDRS